MFGTELCRINGRGSLAILEPNILLKISKENGVKKRHLDNGGTAHSVAIALFGPIWGLNSAHFLEATISVRNCFHGTVHYCLIQMIVEFRIPLPIAVDDFEVAQLYMITRLQENVTGGGEGVVVLKNEPYGRDYQNDE